MKTTKIAILTLVAVGVALAGIAFAGYADGGSRRSGQDGYSPFASGYINAAMKESEAVANQAHTPRRSMLDNIIEYVQNRLARQTDEDNYDKQRMGAEFQRQLQQKSGAVQTAPAAAAAAEGETINIDFGEGGEEGGDSDVPSDIRDAVHEYINANGKDVMGSYDIKSSLDNYFVTWGEKTVYSGIFPAATVELSPDTIKMQVFDSSGNALLEDVEVLTDASSTFGSVEDMVSFSNGHVSIFWREQNAAGSGLLKSRTFDSCGTALSSGTITTKYSESAYAGLPSQGFQVLSNGNIAVVWGERAVESGAYRFYLKTQIFDHDGTAICTPYTLTQDRALTGYAGDAIVNGVANLSNGDMAVLWRESTGYYSHELRYQVFHVDGSPASQQTVLSGARTIREGWISDVGVLANGHLIAFWKQNTSIKSQIFGADGNAVSEDPTLIVSNSTVLDFTVKALSGGNLCVYWQDRSSGGIYSIRSQVLGASGQPAGDLATLGGDYGVNRIESAVLDNGDIAFFWMERNAGQEYILKSQVVDPNGTLRYETPVQIASGEGDTLDAGISEIMELSDGKTMVFWADDMREPTGGFIRAQILNQDGSAQFQVPIYITGGNTAMGGSIENATLLPDGHIIVFCKEAVIGYYGYTLVLKAQIFDQEGNSVYDVPIELTGNTFRDILYIKSVMILSSGEIRAFWKEEYMWGSSGSYFGSYTLYPEGSEGSSGNAGLRDLGRYAINNFLLDQFGWGSYSRASYGFMDGATSFTWNDKLTGAFRDLLDNKALFKKGLDAKDAMTGKLSKGELEAMATTMSLEDMNMMNMRIIAALSYIINNPTEDQKTMIEMVKALLGDLDDVKEEAIEAQDKNTENIVKEAENVILQAAAQILLAQAIPDLIKPGDMDSIKGIFKELDTAKSRVIMEYQEETESYYNKLKNDIIKNMDVLQLNSLIPKDMTEQELKKAPRSEIDKIIEKLRAKKQLIFEEGYIVEREAKYRERYIDPSKKKFDAGMKQVLQSVTKKLFGALEAAKK